MEVRTSEETKENVKNFAKELVALLNAKKKIDEEIKELKNGYKEVGVPVNIVSKAISKVKSNKKKSEFEILEEEAIQEWIESDKDLDNDIGMLAAK